jgi:O-antigen/teichoic acid export membrane protein
MWFTGLSAFERLIAVAQTILIARSLGITEYGVYGLLFGTMGLLASVAGLQMGLTATVFVARYRDTEKQKAAAVISIVGRFGWIIAAAILLAALPFTEKLSLLLLGSESYKTAILLSVLFVGGSILSGVQDGIAQGFEIFKILAKLKIALAVVILAVIYPVADTFGLIGALCVLLGALVLKYLLLNRAVSRCRAEAEIPAIGSGVSFRALVSNFALPSMLVSLAVGFVTWLGMFILSRQQSGFDGVAIVNTGLQWRGPILLLASTVGAVAVPSFSRFFAGNDVAASRKLRRTLVLLNGSIALIVALVLIMSSGLILELYGSEFSDGRLAFCLIVVSMVPTVVTTVYMQELVGLAQMWRQFWLHVPFLTVMFISFLWFIPSYHELGYAASILAGSIVLFVHVLFADFYEHFRNLRSKSGMT